MGLWEQFPNINLLFLFFFTDDSCPKPPEIANGHVEYSVRYHCKDLYRLRTGDGKSWTRVPATSPSWHFQDERARSGCQKVQVLSLDPDFDSNKDFVTSSCGLLGKLTLLSPKCCLLLRGGDAT